MAARTMSRSCIQLSREAPAVRAFLKIASQRPLHTAPIFDFLAPSLAPRSLHQGCRQSVPTNKVKFYMGRRAFTTSRPKRATAAIHNPKKDDDGNEMAIEITPRASNRLKEIMAKDENPNLALRITVESGGCHGFQYLMSLTTLPPLDSVPPPPSVGSSAISEAVHAKPNTPAFVNTIPKVTELDEDDTVFAATDGSEAKVIIDGPSLEILKGSKVDYTMELIGSQFKIVDNPLATSSCGCGTSFDIKA